MSPGPTSQGRRDSTADLDRARREHDLHGATAAVSDVVVVGGGITGAGIALDAATRGLTVTLVEARDLAYGTSRWSSKLVHGGLRYLAHGDVAVAWESARERHHLMTRIAPHLVRPLPHVVPRLAGESAAQAALVRTGLAAADALRRAAGTPRSVLPGSRGLSAAEVARVVPGVDPTMVRGGAGYWDGQVVDDARLVVAVARTAAAHGARILTRLRAHEVSADGVVVHDTLAGGTHELRARHVILATGVWTGAWDPGLPVRLSRGTHVLVRPGALGHPTAALTVPAGEGRSRYVFALPQREGPLILGLTDVPADAASPDDTAPPPEEIAWVLERMSTVLRAPIGPDDVVGAYSGYRPLVAEAGDDRATADISRRHRVHRRADGVVVVTGGKLTTYRRMAADALDAIPEARARACRTTDIPLIGARPTEVPADDSLPARLRYRYGSEAGRIAALADDDPAWAGEVGGSGGVLRAEVVHAIRHEGALTVDDILARRTRLSVQPEAAAATRAEIARIAREVDPLVLDLPVDA